MTLFIGRRGVVRGATGVALAMPFIRTASAQTTLEWVAGSLGGGICSYSPIMVDGASGLFVSNCVFTGNRALDGGSGGGLFARAGGQLADDQIYRQHNGKREQVFRIGDVEGVIRRNKEIIEDEHAAE